MAVPVGGVTARRNKLHRRPGAEQVVNAVNLMAFAIDFNGLRLHFENLSAVVHQQFLGGGLGVPRLGEDLLHRFGLVLLATDDLTGRTPPSAGRWRP